MNHKVQLGLFDEAVMRNADLHKVREWPDAERFPYNFKDSKVESILLRDISESSSPLIVTGFTSLDYLIDFIADLPSERPQTIRIVIGSEPFRSKRSDYSIKGQSFPQDVVDYWLDAGISLRLCHKIVLFIKMIEDGRIQSRFIADKRRKLHGKIYIGDAAATLGSSNFSFTGMQRQYEANARFLMAEEPERYQGTALLAENYWVLGADYNKHLLQLLEQLLSVVTWREALGRACGELLEGTWADKYIASSPLSNGLQLWPSQKAGIVQTLWMVKNVGSVLVADATGSGKTRMGAHLLRAVMDMIWSTGRARKDISALVCPPGTVTQAWKQEALDCGLPLKTLSHGVLSYRGSDKHDQVIQTIRRAQSLAIDEAHNFLNTTSARTKGVQGNMADVVIMFTATPINKGVRDLLRIVDLLGADNLEESALKLFERLEKRMKKQSGQLTTTREERLEMQKEVGRFTLRRTKAMLNGMVDRAPDKYCDDRGKACRYPEHKSRTYSTNEDARDQERADKIRELAGKLKGLSNLRNGIEMPESLRALGVDEDAYVRGRLRGAQGLALYLIMSRLRSSKVALLEHLLGTEKAAKHFGITAHIKNEETGNILGTLKESSGKVHPSSLQAKLPEWLVDPEKHRLAVEEEVRIYEEILSLLSDMSDQREQAKVDKLLALQKKHRLLIAFDSCLITLDVIKKKIDSRQTGCEVIVATGAKKKEKKRVNDLFAPGSEAFNTIALCSDAMSEGLNLQQASSVVLLDMPSVIRIAEQRVGRVDRMNSPHKQIEVWWPKDSDAFSLKTDRKFLQRHQEVADILGSNIILPEGLFPEELQEDNPVTAEDMIEKLDEMARKGESWDGLQDAFQPVRDLVGPEIGIVPQAIYDQVCHSQAKVVSAVSLVRSQKPWAFMAIAGATQGAPKWIYFDSITAVPKTHLEDIARQLRTLLSDKVEEHQMDEAASDLISKFLTRMLEVETSLLPRKKQRALDEMGKILDHYIDTARKERGNTHLGTMKGIRAMLDIPKHEEERPDLDAVAEAWLDLIREAWYERLARRKRYKPLRLKDIRRTLKEKPIEPEKLAEAFSKIPLTKPIHTRVVAAIVGVPGSAGERVPEGHRDGATVVS